MSDPLKALTAFLSHIGGAGDFAAFSLGIVFGAAGDAFFFSGGLAAASVAVFAGIGGLGIKKATDAILVEYRLRKQQHRERTTLIVRAKRCLSLLEESESEDYIEQAQRLRLGLRLWADNSDYSTEEIVSIVKRSEYVLLYGETRRALPPAPPQQLTGTIGPASSG